MDTKELILRNYSVKYISGKNPVIENLDFSVKKGEIVGITGESGRGKSSLLLSLLGLLDREATITGKAEYNGHDLLNPEIVRKLRGDDITMVFQNGKDILNPSLKVKTQLREAAFRSKTMSEALYEKRRKNILQDLGIDSKWINKYPSQLSGGMYQKIMICMALLPNPDIILIDEPTSSLDQASSMAFVRLIQKLHKKHAFSLIISSHDLPMLKKISHRIISLSEENTEVFKMPHNSSKKSFHRRLANIKSVTKEYLSQKEKFIACQSFSLNILAGKTYGIIGTSGSGKTTAANIMAGFIKPDKGSVHLYDQTNIEIIWQDPNTSMNPNWTVWEVLTERYKYNGEIASDLKKKVNSLLQQLKLPNDMDFLSSKVKKLSGGQKQRVNIARSLLINPEVLIADEITSMLDERSALSLIEGLIEIQKQREMALIFISHDLKWILSLVDELIIMNHGSIEDHCQINEVFSHGRSETLSKLLEAYNEFNPMQVV